VPIEGDEARLTQVFSNLLTNAAKYTEPGGHILVKIRQTGNQVAVEVHDDGSGIDAALLPKVFEMFVQGHQRTDRRDGGLGLGLTLVRSLVTLHGGQVEARSDGPGQGSSFTVRLPALHRAEGTDDAEATATGFRPAQHKRRILIVDDNEDARFLLSEILVAVGHEVKTAGDGVGALTLVKGFTPEVAILDIGLPVMDGYELAAQLREALTTVAPHMIALTGYGQPADQERTRAAGFAQHLVKPVDVRRLLDSIAQLPG
jgi:CheY-like chemotaxis protein/anti-sigma regulatory factor (Ser/Thr protein kinase)